MPCSSSDLASSRRPLASTKAAALISDAKFARFYRISPQIHEVNVDLRREILVAIQNAACLLEILGDIEVGDGGVRLQIAHHFFRLVRKRETFVAR